MERRVTPKYWVDDGWHVGRIKEAPGVFSQGATLAELEDDIAHAYDAVAVDTFDPVPANEIHRKQLCRLIRRQLGLPERPDWKGIRSPAASMPLSQVDVTTSTV